MATLKRKERCLTCGHEGLVLIRVPDQFGDELFAATVAAAVGGARDEHRAVCPDARFEKEVSDGRAA